MYFRALISTLIFVSLFVTAGVSYAVHPFPEKDSLISSIDSNYIVDYTERLSARFFLLFQNASLMLNTQNIDKIVYRPNVNVKIGLAANWKWFGLGVSIDNPFYKRNEGNFGHTSTIDLRANAFSRKFAAELLFQRYTGFYISNPERADGTNYIIPDMSTFSIGIAGFWIYNPSRFSIRAAFIQTERQKKSAGSLIVRPSFSFYTISSDNGIIPQELIAEYNIPSSSQIIRGDFYAIGLSPGYIYTFVFLKNMYVTAAILPGVAAQIHSYHNNKGNYSDFEFSFQLGGRFALGYNSEAWFIGGSYQAGFNTIPDKLSNAMFNYDVAQLRVWGGARFDIFRKKKTVPLLTK